MPGFQPQSCPRIAKTATVKDILNQLTGLPDPYSLYTGFDGTFRFSDDNSLLNILNNLEASDEDFRVTWTYNSLAYALLGILIEKISESSFADFMTSRVFAPLGMRNTAIATNQSKNIERAKPYIILEGNTIQELPTKTLDGNGFAASFGMESPLNDLLTWSQAVIEAVRMDPSTSVRSSRSKVLAAIRRTVEPGCQIQVTDDGVMSFRNGWFHTTGQSISFDIFYDPTIGSAGKVGFPSTAGADQDSSYHSSFENRGFKPNSRSILYSNGYIKGFTSNLYIYPDLGHAVVVLGNSTGRSEPCGYISRLLTALVCGDEIPPDLITVLRKEVEEFANRWETLAHALDLGNRDYYPITQSDCTKFTGCYKNAEIGLEINIHFCDSCVSGSHSLPPDSSSLLFSFGDQNEVQLFLWKYENSVLCFFPSKKKFKQLIMPPFTDASQYFLHMHIANEGVPATGLWWQYGRAFDALWLDRQAYL